MRKMRNTRNPYILRSKVRRAMDRVLTGLILLGVVAGVGAIGYFGYIYRENGFENCRANGSSYTWCNATIGWQSVKALFQR